MAWDYNTTKHHWADHPIMQKKCVNGGFPGKTIVKVVKRGEKMVKEFEMKLKWKKS